MPELAHVGRILVICTRQIGDVLLTTPLVSLARQRWPEARIDFLGFAGSLETLRGNPDLGQLIEAPAGAGWRRSWPLIRRLWRRYDLALVCETSDRAHLFGWIAAPVRAGQVSHEPQANWWKRLTSRHVAVLLWQTHALLQKLQVLEPWASPSPQIEVKPPADVALPEPLRAALAARFVVIQAPSLVRYKQWPLAHYAELVAALVGRGVQVVLTGSGSAFDREVTARLAQLAAAPLVLDMAGQLSLPQVAALLRRAALYIGPDTSVTHLAAACEVPLIALYGPTDPTYWGPWPQRAPPTQPYQVRADVQRVGRIILLQGPQPCVPCRMQGCDRHNDSRSECLETMSPQRVLQEAGRVLGLRWESDDAS